MDAFEHIWSLLPHPEGSVVRWFAKSSDLRIGEYATSAKTLRSAAANHVDKNFYIQPNPTTQKAGIRVNANAISHWSYFLVDIDPIPNMPDARPDLVMDEVLLWFGEWMGWDFKRDSPMLLDSGRGMQAWFRLEDTPFDVASSEYSRRMVSSAMSYWLQSIARKVGVLHQCKLDTTTSDLPRIMRCPGSINQRTGRTATIVSEGVCFKGLAHRIITLTPKSTLLAAITPPTERHNHPYQIILPLLTLRAKNFIQDGVDSPGRHTAIQHAAKTLWEKGCCERELRKAIKRGNEKCLPEPVEEKEIERILRDVMKESVNE